MTKKLEAIRIEVGNRLTLPESVMRELRVEPGGYFLATTNPDYRELILHAIPDPSKLLYELKIEMTDIPGSLGKICDSLGSAKINIEGATLVPGGKKISVGVFVIDMSTSKLSKESLIKKLKRTGRVLNVEFKALNF